MIRTIIGLALAGVMLTPFAEKATLSSAPAEQADVDRLETSSLASKNRLVYDAAAPSGEHCRMLVDLADGAMAPVQAEAACAQVYGGLETVVRWSPASGGTVRLIDAAGAAIMEIGASDGFAYEAVSPGAAQVMISEIDG